MRKEDSDFALGATAIAFRKPALELSESQANFFVTAENECENSDCDGMSQQAALSADTAATLASKQMIADMKQRKMLHYRPSLELGQLETVEHYRAIAVNTANTRADRILKKCKETMEKLELISARGEHIRNSSAQLDLLVNNSTSLTRQ